MVWARWFQAQSHLRLLRIPLGYVYINMKYLPMPPLPTLSDLLFSWLKSNSCINLIAI